jgi:uncharacterized protein (DUF2141 family)
MKKIAFIEVLAVITLLSLAASCTNNGNSNTTTNLSVQSLQQLANDLVPYSLNFDCGFEAVSVWKKFGGSIVIAQNPVPDGIYDLKRMPGEFEVAVVNSANGSGGQLPHGFLGPWEWNGIKYDYLLSLPGLGMYELIPIEITNITTHRGIDMKNNGPHVWNIINDLVIDISWARQIPDTFLNSVFVNGDNYMTVQTQSNFILPDDVN